MALDQLELQSPYYTIHRANWTFIILDSLFYSPKRPSGYQARLDQEQFFWLGEQLQKASPNSFICIVSHIPILSFCSFFDGENEKSGNWRVPGEWMHLDARRLKSLFTQFSQVKACLSGHIHLVDEVQYLNVTYYCNGAVCGGWWNGPYQEFKEAFAIIDFFPDGTTRRTLVEY